MGDTTAIRHLAAICIREHSSGRDGAFSVICALMEFHLLYSIAHFSLLAFFPPHFELDSAALGIV